MCKDKRVLLKKEPEILSVSMIGNSRITIYLVCFFLMIPVTALIPGALRSQTIEDFYTTLVSQEELMQDGRKMLDERRYQDAHKAFDQAAVRKPDDAGPFLGRGEARYQLESYKAASRDYTKVLDLDPESVEAMLGRGKAQYHLGYYEAARRDFTGLIERSPKTIEAYVMRGHTLVLLKEYEGAVRDYSRALELDPMQAGIFYNRAKARAALGDSAAADADFRKAAEFGLKPAAEWLKEHGKQNLLPR